MNDLIKIAADDISSLRGSDVFRVLEWHRDQRARLAAFIISNRPDLAREVEECLVELA